MKFVYTALILTSLLIVPSAWAGPVSGLDSKKPVEINADSLEVRQKENIAEFKGNVIAVQGETRLKSSRMVVYYQSKNGGAAANPSQSTVEKIEVYGNVILTTPEETATGNKGVYDVANKKVKLLNNVVLKQGDNVLKGDSLVYDFATGKSVINSPYHTPNSEPGSTGRVKALFIPKDKE